MKVKKGAVRALAAGIMMILFLVFFLDFYPPLTDFLGQAMAWIQFFPALIIAISGSHRGVMAFLLLVLLCLVSGRIYCAVLCPLGIFQDAVIFLSRRRGKPQPRGKMVKDRSRPRAKNDHGDNPNHSMTPKPSDISPLSGNSGVCAFLWYAILTFTTTLLLSGSLFFVNLLDPFSVFGRFLSQLALPVGATINNLMVSLAESVGQYVFFPVNLRPVLWPVFWITYGWFVLVISISFYHGRRYCNSLCPVGAFFSLLSRHSLFGFVIDRQKCTTCGKCQRMCRSHCMDPATGKIDNARCVSCFDCVDVCPEHAITYTIISEKFKAGNERWQKDLSPSVEKRKFILTGVSLCGGVLATALPLRPLLARMALVGTVAHDPITPPGSLGIDHFSHTCLACHACVSACPENVLMPGVDEYGLTGALQPRLDFFVSRCAYSCNACTLVCPSGAILPLSLEEKQRTRIGSVHFERDKCLVYTQKRDCGACAEVCPTHAVHTVLENNIHHPRIRSDACIGCGACQLVCPVTPKAIYVVATRVHETAGPPFFQQDPPAAPTGVMGSDADFPF